ncbi:C-type mannose receptor 2-like [Takifugu rubripes]|uniref:C-type mannose receptor 2-like n=1 Tax=Takifugu rubripes TaxID=31033 RepID=UPI001145FE6F|nr:C-type mannose receptor 2-like [Takifugu rubripes]
MLHLAGLLLLAGSITLCTHVHQEYVLVSKNMMWGAARAYCRENHTDLATIESLKDMKMLASIAAARSITGLIWIGLKKYELKSWMWSSGDTPGLTGYTNWATLPTSSNNCGALSGDGKWLGVLCTETLPFVCQTDNGSYEVILTKLSWKEANNYCHKRGKDLARARSRTENQAVQEVLSGHGSYFWIGLFRDGWTWSDQSDASFRYWASTQPNNDGHCTLFNAVEMTWWDRSCKDHYYFFCYNAITVVRRMAVKIKSSSSLNFSDSKMSDALLSQASVESAASFCCTRRFF